MFKKSLIYFLNLGLLFSFSQKVFAYDDKTTHPALSDEVVDFYNLSFPDKQLTLQQKEWVIEGSILEDTPPRWINHFYDPIRQVGWTGDKTGNLSVETMRLLSHIGFTLEDARSAVKWVNEKFIQERYSLYGGDRTWKKGLEYFADGNEKESYTTLGYVLHLLEDMSVPEHTRDDTHAQEVGAATGDPGSPYEQYARQHTREKLNELKLAENLKAQNLQIATKNSVEDYLISLAEYSNKYFFSKDTVNDLKYALPKIIRDDGNFGYGLDENNKEFPLVKTKMQFNNQGQFQKIYLLDKNDPQYYPILSAYWSRLSKQAILHGAGLINLFQRQAVDELVNREFKQPSNLQYFNPIAKIFPPIISLYGESVKLWNYATGLLSGAKDFLSDTASALGKTFKDVFGTKSDQPALVLNLADIDNANIANQNANDANRNLNDANSNSNPAKPKTTPRTNLPNVIPDQPKLPPENPTSTDEQTESQTEPQLVVSEVKPEESPLPEPEPDADTPTNLEQTALALPNFCDFNPKPSPLKNVLINEIAWMGTAENASNEWLELKNQTGATINLKGWRLLDPTKKIEIVFDEKDKINSSGFYLMERTDDKSLPNIKADKIYTGALSNGGEWLRLFNDKCELVDEIDARPVSGKSDGWAKFGGNNTTKQTMERNPDSLNWQTSLTASGTPKAQNTRPAAGSGGVSGSPVGSSQTSNPQVMNSTSTPTSTPATSISTATSTPFTDSGQAAKLLITEVQITGGTGQSNNDFIEIYNPNASTVNLNGYRLVKRTKTGTSDASIKSWTTDTTIPAQSFYVWAHNDYTTLTPAPDTTTSAILSDNYGVAIRFGATDTGTIIDSVAWGEAQNSFMETAAFASNPGANQGLHRKFQNGNFIDANNNQNDFELKNCISPKQATSSCETVSAQSSSDLAQTSSTPTSTESIAQATSTSSEQATSTDQNFNQAPGAFFVYTPIAPAENEEIFFNAASSSDADGQIVLYEWSFGDTINNASSTNATTTHVYAVAGNYLTALTVQDNVGATSTATTTIIVTPAGTAHAVISEMQTGATDPGDEFIELYNPTTMAMDISGWSIQYIGGAATSSASVARKNFESGNAIPARGFFLIARGKNESGSDGYNGATAPDMTYRSFAMSGASNGGKIFLVANQENISSFSDPDIIDATTYSPQTLPQGQSAERKAFQNEGCTSAMSGSTGEFSGHGCDTVNMTDFEIRQSPQPQNSLSLPEPRAKPTISNFSAQYIITAPRIDFSWGLSADAIGETSANTYVLNDTSSGSPNQIYTGTSTAAQMTFDEVGRDYSFEFKVEDRDGLENSATTTVAAASFASNVHFYKDTRNGAQDTRNILDITPTSSRPFWDGNDGNNQNWKLIISYFNHDAPKQQTIDTNHNLIPDDTNRLSVEHKACHGQGESPGPVLVFAYNNYSCQSGGPLSGAMPMPEDNRLAIKAFSPHANLATTDYATLAFYDFGGGGGGNQWFNLAAVDKTKYYFETAPAQNAPTQPENFSVGFDDFHSTIGMSWLASTDPDSPDSQIAYEINYATSTILAEAAQAVLQEARWQSVGANTNSNIAVVQPYAYKFAVHAKDDFGNISSSSVQTWGFPENYSPLPAQSDHGAQMAINSTDGSYGQTILINATATVDGIEAWISPLGGWKNNSESGINIYEYANGTKGNFVANSDAFRMDQYDAPTAHLYLFNPAITLEAGKTYWFAPMGGPQSYTNETAFWGSTGNPYSDGGWNGGATSDIYFRLHRAGE